MDKNFWNKYYKNHGQDKGIIIQSSFSEFCEEKFFFKKKLNIVELGSGNGRDAIFFAQQEHKVIALDQSTTAIDFERTKVSSNVNSNLLAIASDFVKDDFNFDLVADAFYSRFTLHAISKEDEDYLLPKVYNALDDNGLFCIEVRTTKDPLYGVGKYCGDNIYLTDHKRRFIDSDEFIKTILKIGFKIVYFTEEDNLSIYKEDNPVLMRIILKK